MTKLPRITITPNDGGWLAICGVPGCGFLAWHQRRPAIDKAAHDHMPTHQKTQKGA